MFTQLTKLIRYQIYKFIYRTNESFKFFRQNLLYQQWEFNREWRLYQEHVETGLSMTELCATNIPTSHCWDMTASTSRWNCCWVGVDYYHHQLFYILHERISNGNQNWGKPLARFLFQPIRSLGQCCFKYCINRNKIILKFIAIKHALSTHHFMWRKGL